MQRKYIALVGILLVLLVLVGGAVVLTLPRPAPAPAPAPTPPQPTAQVSHAFDVQPGDTVVTLTWQTVPGAAGYAVYRDGNAAPLNPAPLTTTRYSDIGLSNGRSYTYTVGIVDAAGKTGQRLAETTVVPKSR